MYVCAKAVLVRWKINKLMSSECSRGGVTDCSLIHSLTVHMEFLAAQKRVMHISHKIISSIHLY